MFDLNDPNQYAQQQGTLAPTLPGGQASPAQMPNVNPILGWLAPLYAQALQKATQQQPQQPTSSLPASTVAQATGKSLNPQPAQPQAPTSKLSSSAVSQALKPGKSTQNAAGTINHVVQPGDTLWGIAHQYTGSGDNWSKLGGFNFHQDPRILKVGSVIQIPQSLARKQNIGPAPSNIARAGGMA